MGRIASFGWALLVLPMAVLAASRIRPLNADEVRRTVVGKAITDGTHWRYHLKPDGAIDAFEMGRARQGRWHLDGNRLCIAIQKGAAPDQCFDVMREGKQLVFGVQGQVIYDVKVEAASH